MFIQLLCLLRKTFVKNWENKISKENKWEDQFMILTLDDSRVLLGMFSLVWKTKLKDSIAVGVSSVKKSVQPCYSA